MSNYSHSVHSPTTDITYEIIRSDGWITVRWNDDDGECFTSPMRPEALTEQDLPDGDFGIVRDSIASLNLSPESDGDKVKTDTIVTFTKALTCADHDPGDEWPDFVRQERIAARAAERHESRVRAAEWALAQLFRDGQDDGEPIAMTEGEVRRARTLAAIEVHGIGGPRGYSGGATRRMPWASSLGKGRHNASDGASWDAAIAQVFGGNLNPTPSEVIEVIDRTMSSDDIAWGVAYASARAVASFTPDEARAWDAVRNAALIWETWLTDPDADASSNGMAAVEAQVRALADDAAKWPANGGGVRVEIVSRRDDLRLG